MSDGVSNHPRLDCLLKRIENSKARDTGLCDGNSLVTGEFPTQRARNAENICIWWHHHGQNQFPVNGLASCLHVFMCPFYHIFT